jgi:ribosomal protein L37AE/L43A
MSSWIETKAFDCFGRELETHQCEYCGQVKPVKLWNGINGSGETFNILMVEFIGRDGHKAWMCKECSVDIADRT